MSAFTDYVQSETDAAVLKGMASLFTSKVNKQAARIAALNAELARVVDKSDADARSLTAIKLRLEAVHADDVAPIQAVLNRIHPDVDLADTAEI